MKPNYTQGNIVHLMSSILQGSGSSSRYQALPILPPKMLASVQNIILLVVDGLGYDQVIASSGFLRKHLAAKLTTVFPPTTTAAITTFFTGLTPQEHGFIAWYMRMKEFGNQVVIMLPYITRDGKPLNSTTELSVPPSIFQKIRRESYVVIPKVYLRSRYNALLLKGATVVPYRARKLAEWTTATVRAVNSSSGSSRPKFICTYWPNYDDFCHYYGKESTPARQQLKEVDAAIERLAQQLQGTNTLLLITADHGHNTTTKKRTIILEQHPAFLRLLAVPMCGEARAAIIHVIPGKEKEAEKYGRKNWRKCSTLCPSEELVRQGYFGTGKFHPSFRERLGDYILLSKENYAFRQRKISKKHPLTLGHHGGISKEELEVPLVKVFC